MSNKPKLKVFSFYMSFIFLFLLGAQYILLDLYSSRLFAFQENLLSLKTIQARPLVETLVLIAGLLLINILARFAIIRFGRRKLQIKKDMVEKYLNPKTFFYFYRLISKWLKLMVKDALPCVAERRSVEKPNIFAMGA